GEREGGGGRRRRMGGGEFLVGGVIPPAVIDDLTNAGKIAAGSHVNLASVGIGVVVKEGAAKPDVSTVEAFRQALLEAKSVAYIDPASGGSSGIYVDRLLERLGIADKVRPKAKLKKGGYGAEPIGNWRAQA